MNFGSATAGQGLEGHLGLRPGHRRGEGGGAGGALVARFRREYHDARTRLGAGCALLNPAWETYSMRVMLLAASVSPQPSPQGRFTWPCRRLRAPRNRSAAAGHPFPFPSIRRSPRRSRRASVPARQGAAGSFDAIAVLLDVRGVGAVVRQVFPDFLKRKSQAAEFQDEQQPGAVAIVEYASCAGPLRAEQSLLFVKAEGLRRQGNSFASSDTLYNFPLSVTQTSRLSGNRRSAAAAARCSCRNEATVVPRLRQAE